MSEAWRLAPPFSLMTPDDAPRSTDSRNHGASTPGNLNATESANQSSPEHDAAAQEPAASAPDVEAPAPPVEGGEGASVEPSVAGTPAQGEGAAEATSGADFGGKPGAKRGEGATAPKRSSPGPAKATDPADSASSDTYVVNLPNFEGPLDLLLHLVRKHELDILDIPIAFVTEKYTQYVEMMQDLNIDTASEYLVMAATLIHIKTRMLLPDPPTEELDEESDDPEDDPRAELVRRLLEYQKYKDAAQQLGTRSVLGRDVFPRGSTAEVAAGPAPLMQVSVFKLLDAFQSVLLQGEQTQEHEIDFERISISDKIGQLAELLRDAGRLPFTELFARGAGRAELIITFLAILEMTKLRMTRLFQEGPLEEIYVELTVSDDDDSNDSPHATTGNDDSQGPGDSATGDPAQGRGDHDLRDARDPLRDRADTVRDAAQAGDDSGEPHGADAQSPLSSESPPTDDDRDD